MKYEAICKYSSQHSVRKMCSVLGLREFGYYRWLARHEKRLVKRREASQLVSQVGEVFEANRRVYGYRKMQRVLERSGIYLSEYKVRKIMRENGYYPVTARKYKPMCKGKSDGRYYADAVKQDFKAEHPNKVWTGDITYIKTNVGFAYLATVIDLYNRECIGYSISKTADTALVKTALGNALVRAGGAHAGVIFHSDRGCQYSSKSYQRMLEEHEIIGSMGRPACPYDNACVESFFQQCEKGVYLSETIW